MHCGTKQYWFLSLRIIRWPSTRFFNEQLFQEQRKRTSYKIVLKKTICWPARYDSFKAFNCFVQQEIFKCCEMLSR